MKENERHPPLKTEQFGKKFPTDRRWKRIEAAAEKLADILEKADDAGSETAVAEEEEKIRAIIEELPYTHLSLEGWNGDVLMEKFESPLWEELYKPCLACGTCTFVCPTCHLPVLRHQGL